MSRRRALLSAGGLALFAAALSAFLAVRVFEGIPHVADGVSYAFQGQVLASGHFTLSPPPVPEAFQLQNVLLKNGRWASFHPPGFCLLLAPGWWAGVPWLVNPLFLGLAVLGVFRLGQVLYDDLTGVLGAAALAVSPFALLMGASFMSHPACLAFSVWSLALLAKGARSGRFLDLAGAGALGAFAFLVRPFSAVPFLLPAVFWTLATLRRRPALLRGLLALALGALPMVALFLAYNTAVAGHPLRLPYMVENRDAQFTYGFTLLELIGTHLPWYAHDVSYAFWGWPWPAPLLLLPLLFKSRKEDFFLLSSAAGLILFYSSFRYYDVNHSGPRYAFEALAPLGLLVSRGLLTAWEAARARVGLLSRSAAARGAVAVAAALLLLVPPLFITLPEQARSLSHAYHAHTAAPLSHPYAARVGPDALILVAGPTKTWTYGPFALLNGGNPVRARRVWALDVPSLRPALLAAYPRKEVWRLFVALSPRPPENVFIDNTWDVAEVVWERLR